MASTESDSDIESDSNQTKRSSYASSRTLQKPQNATSSKENDVDSCMMALSKLLLNPGPTRYIETFSFGGIWKNLPTMPGLNIKGIGLVAFPVLEDQANKIIAAAKRAPFGRGKETLVDLNIRRTWQIDAADITMKNPLFIQELDKLKTEIARRIDCPEVPLDLHLYKFLLYEPGAHFAKHRDTEKESGMFGTLVIQLPSVYKGGQLKVFHKFGDNQEEIVHDFGQSEGMAPFACHYAFHYADAEHQVERISDGYRAVLIYSVCWPPRQMHKYKLPSAEITRPIAAEMKKIRLIGEYFMLFLEHGYTEKSVKELGKDAQKGIDRAREALLIAANKTLPEMERFNFYLVTAERQCSYYSVGGEDYKAWKAGRPNYSKVDWELLQTSVSDNWNLLEGDESKSFHIEIDFNGDVEYIPNMLNLGRNPAWNEIESDYEGYLGNQNLTKNTTYSRYLIVALQSSPPLSFLTKYTDFETTFINVVRQSGDLITLRNLFKQQEKEKHSIEPSSLGECLKYIVEANFIELVEKFFDLFKDDLFKKDSFSRANNEISSNNLNTELRKAVIVLMKSNMWKMVEKKFFQLLSQSNNEVTEALKLLNLAQAATVDGKIRTQLSTIVNMKVLDVQLSSAEFVRFWWQTMEKEGQLKKVTGILKKKLPIDTFLSLDEPSMNGALMKTMMKKVGEDQMKKPEFVDKIFNYYLEEAPNELIQFCTSKLSMASADWIIKKATSLEKSPDLQTTLIEIALPKMTAKQVRNQDFMYDACILFLQTSKQNNAGKKRLDAFLNQCLTLLREENLNILLNVIMDAEVKKLFCGHDNSVQKLVKIRYDWLVKTKQPTMKFPQIWSEQYPVLYAFLRSDEQQITKRGSERSPKFNDIGHARNYAAQFSSNGIHCEIGKYLNMTPGGTGKKTYVNVTKSNLWYTMQNDMLKEYEEELKRLKLILEAHEAELKGPAIKKIRLNKS